MAADSLGSMPYLGQCGRLVAFDYDEGVTVAATAYFRPTFGSDADWRAHDIEMGEIAGWREVRVVGIEDESSQREQLHKARCVLIADKHEQESNWDHSYNIVNREWTGHYDEYTMMAQDSNCSNGCSEATYW